MVNRFSRAVCFEFFAALGAGWVNGFCVFKREVLFLFPFSGGSFAFSSTLSMLTIVGWLVGGQLLLLLYLLLELL